MNFSKLQALENELMGELKKSTSLQTSPAEFRKTVLEKSNQLTSVDRLMYATYHGRYADSVLHGNLAMRNKTPNARFGGQHNIGFSAFHPVYGKDLLKADDPHTTAKTNYFDPFYGKAVVNWLDLEADIFKLIPKQTYAEEGGSWRHVDTAPTNFWGQLETHGALGDTDIPAVTKSDYDDPAVMYSHWDGTLLANLKSTTPGWDDPAGGNTIEWFKGYMAKQHASDINAKLMTDVDTPAAPGGSFDNYIESIDRVCSDAAESAITSAATDPDIHGFDRSANEAEAYVDLNAAADRDLTLDLIDDMMATISPFSDNNRYIIITDRIQLNTIEALEGVSRRFVANSPENPFKISTENGVNTREGVQAGFSISTIHTNGIEIPIFVSKDTFVSGSGNGNLYALDLDHIAIRWALPTVFIDTTQQNFLLLDKLFYVYMFLSVAQLVADQYNCHGAIKYLN